ncbi:unnamed protein product, partial [Iphiclides podalirius]
MQEPKTDKDDDYCRRINEALNNPPTSGGRGGGGSGAQDGELQNLLNNMSQQQLMQLFGGVGQIGGLSSLLGTMGNSSSSGTGSGSGSARASGGSAASSRGGSAPRTSEPAPAPAAPAAPARTTTRREVPPAATPPNTASATQPRSGQIFLSDLQRYFSGLGNAPAEGGPGAEGGSSAAAAAGADRVELGAALASPDVVAAASEPRNAQRLAPHLPTPAAQPHDDAANQFSSALTSGQMGPVISQFGLPPEVASAANSGDMQAFFKALENSSNASDSSKSQEEDKKKETTKEEKDTKKDDDAGITDKVDAVNVQAKHSRLGIRGSEGTVRVTSAQCEGREALGNPSGARPASVSARTPPPFSPAHSK